MAVFVLGLVVLTGTSGAASLKLTDACNKVGSSHIAASPIFERPTSTQVAKATQYCRIARVSSNKIRVLDRPQNQWRRYKRHWKQKCWKIPHLQESVSACMAARSSMRSHRTRLLKLNRKIDGLMQLRIKKRLVASFTCIHNGHKGTIRVGSGEAAWNANTGNGYYGGLQMNAGFEATYGADMVVKYGGHIVQGPNGPYAVGGHAYKWTPKEQIMVAARAWITRGYHPWPNTAAACGYI